MDPLISSFDRSNNLIQIVLMKKVLYSTPFVLFALRTAAQFLPGNLALVRLGDGTQTLGNTGNTVFIDQYTPLGGLVNSLQIPDSGPSALIMSGNATSEGALSLSGDGHYLAIAGYNTTRPFGSSLASSTSATVPRGIGSIGANGSYTLAATTTSQYSANNIRGGATDGANNFWGSGANSGTYYFGNNAAPGTVQSTVANTRVIADIGGNLFFSTSSGTSRGVWEIPGTPTGAGTASVLLNTGSSGSAYDFAFNPSMTIAYVADDTSSAAGGIERWDFNGSTWSLTYTLGTGTANVGARGLAVDFSGPTPIIYATTAEATANRLIAITDTGASSAATTLATASANEIFRGLEFTPTIVPEPSSAALFGFGLLVVIEAWRRRNQ
jgi:hypothetical protein